ncbi:hypothetical protein WA026_000798 [Henosepilachna vigintioctopunctata]|uniref:Glycosyl transferase CAP10 domain-containing protein n=1 Tax=Henosepilachna vigintioctopunctata TaxID=420089 RepID=A0AAW1UYS3_9CUCU
MLILVLNLVFLNVFNAEVSPKFCRIWGPGLYPDKIVMPARYFFIEARNLENERINKSISEDFKAVIEGLSEQNTPCRIWTNNLDVKDGSYIIRYKVFEKCYDLKISVTHFNKHVADSPYKIIGEVLPDHCDCPSYTLNNMLKEWKCGNIPKQITKDLESIDSINWENLRKEIISNYDKPYSVSLCHYVIKQNKIYRNCYGKYVGFKMFMDSILLSLSRKAILPDVEFFVNLGDWPLVVKKDKSRNNRTYPIFSWCGSLDSDDIVMPTYDITESSLENMGRVMLDMLSVQGNTEEPWENRQPKAFWRGRDSSKERLKLIKISRNHTDIMNCSLTNFFFFRDEISEYGPKSDHVSFYKFFDYKYQLGLDGTVAAYRFPYLLAGGSLVFKQESKYYEHFYGDLKPYVHYVPIKRNLDDLVEKINWALDNDREAKKIADEGKLFSNKHLLPKNIFCYYSHLLNEFSQRIVSPIVILDKMDKVEQTNQKETCNCNKIYKDEL